MSRPIELPEECSGWMTDEIRRLLRVFRGRNAAKKRRTIIKLAFAKANQQPMSQVFKQEDVCSWRIWHQKWKFDPDVKAAYDACYERALAWADEETAALEDHYRRKRRRSVAEYAAEAPAAMAAVMADREQRGDHRVTAADTLMRWAEPETASKIQPAHPSSGGDQVVNISSEFYEGLERVYGDDEEEAG